MTGDLRARAAAYMRRSEAADSAAAAATPQAAYRMLVKLTVRVQGMALRRMSHEQLRDLAAYMETFNYKPDQTLLAPAVSAELGRRSPRNRRRTR